MLDKLTHTDFEPHVDTIFNVQPDNVRGLEEELPLTLVQVRVSTLQVPVDPERIKRQPFSLLFEAAPEVRLSQGNYTLRHETMPEMTIFMVPVSPTTYEAVFT